MNSGSRASGARNAWRAIVLIATVLFSGCGWMWGGRQEFVPIPDLTPSDSSVQGVDLDILRQSMLQNSLPVLSLVADCQAVIDSKEMRPSRIEASGQLMMAKPGKIYLELRRPGAVLARLVGDGLQYRTEMPMLRLEYGGAYGQPLHPASKRISFVAEDVADALDMSTFFSGTRQLLRSYPQTWDAYQEDLRSPRASPKATYVDFILDVPATGLANASQGQPATVPKIMYSLALESDRARIVALDKFRRDGSLRRRIWFLDWTYVSGPDLSQGAASEGWVSVQVPSEFMIAYLPPLEGTIVRMRLTNIKINVPVDMNRFELE